LNNQVKKYKKCLRDITTANKFKADVWNQYNNILISEDTIMKKLGMSGGDDEDEDEKSEDDEDY